jgi:hypothetical protein
MPAAACRPPVALWPDPPQNGAMRIREFGVETWMNRWETRCRFNLAETCVESLAVGQLLELADIDGSGHSSLPTVRSRVRTACGTR